MRARLGRFAMRYAPGKLVMQHAAIDRFACLCCMQYIGLSSALSEGPPGAVYSRITSTPASLLLPHKFLTTLRNKMAQQDFCTSSRSPRCLPQQDG